MKMLALVRVHFVTRELTRGVVVADSVPGRIRQNSSSRALNSGASDLGSGLPNGLSEVAPFHEVSTCGGVAHAVVGEEVNLAVVPLHSDSSLCGLQLHARDITGRPPRGKILAVTTTTLIPAKSVSKIFMLQHRSLNLHVVGEDATVGSVLSIRGEIVVPLQARGGVIGTVDVMMIHHGGRV